MVTIILHCPHCGSEAMVRDGHAPNGKQKYRCHGCGRRSRENPTPHAYPEARREEILHASSRAQQFARPSSHVWRLSHDRIQLDQKKGMQLPPFSTTLLAPDPADPTSTILEMDELWSFVLKKAQDCWIWIALCRKTRQVVAYAIGDRSRQDVSAALESHTGSLSSWSLLHGFLGGVPGYNPRGPAYRRRKADRGNGSCGTME